MEKSINQRVREFIDSLGVSDNQFAKSIGITQSVIASMFSRNTEPSSKVIVSILNAYANLSAEWLMTGKGEMLQKDSSSSYVDDATTAIKEKIIQYLKYKGITPTKAERELNWGVGAFTKAKSITVDRAKEFLLLYSDLSAEWLLRGEGEMLQKNFSQTNADASLQQIYDSVLKGKDNEIKKLEAEINMLKGENRLLRELAGIEEGKNKSETKTA